MMPALFGNINNRYLFVCISATQWWLHCNKLSYINADGKSRQWQTQNHRVNMSLLTKYKGKLQSLHAIKYKYEYIISIHSTGW